MKIEFDQAKRDETLLHRGLDFMRAIDVFAGVTFTKADDRTDYGEARYVTFGVLDDRMVAIVWTERGDISMRKANDREQARYQSRLG